MRPQCAFPPTSALLALLGTLVCACTATGSSAGLTPVTDSSRRHEIGSAGVAVRPPPGSHWFVQPGGPGLIAFVKSPVLEGSAPASAEEGAHTLGAMVTEVVVLESGLDTPEELRGFVERWLQGGAGVREIPGSALALDPSRQPRFELVESTVRVDRVDGTPCVRFDAVLEERGNPRFPDQVLVQVIRDNVLCRHPQSAEPLYVLAGCSERFLAAHRPQVLLLDRDAREMKAFVDSLEFFPPRISR
jgi:hypothetical protein